MIRAAAIPIEPPTRMNTSTTASARGMKRSKKATAGYTSAATAAAANAQAMTRSADRTVSSTNTVPARANTMTKAERSENRTADNRGADIVTPFPSSTTDPIPFRNGDAINPDPAPGSSFDVDPRSAIPLSLALAALLIGVWAVRSIPRTLSCFAVAALFALAMNRVAELVQRRTHWRRSVCVVTVLAGFAVFISLVLALLVPPTIREVRSFNKQVPHVVRQLDTVPIFGKRLKEADAPRKVQHWLDELPRRLSRQQRPLERVAGQVANGIGAFLLTLLLAVTLLIDGELFVKGLRSCVPERRRARADSLGRLVYDVLGKYIGGSLLVALGAGTVMLTSSLVLGVPLAPLIAVWVMITNPIPQVGGALGGLVFVMLALTQGVGVGVICLVIFLTYQQIENHLLQPMIIGRAVRLS